MSLIWGTVTGTATAIPGVDVGAALALAGYVIVAGIGYWLSSSQPAQPYGVALDWCSDTGGKDLQNP